MTSRKRLFFLAGSLSLLLNGAASASLTAPQAEAPAVSTQAQAAPVAFTAYKNFDDLKRQIPETADIIASYGPGSKNPLLEASGLAAKVSDRLILFRFENEGECGSLGCTLLAFSIGEENYYNSACLVTNGPISWSVTGADKEPSIFVCPNEGQEVEWKRQDSDQLTPVPLAAGQTPSACVPEVSITSSSTQPTVSP